MTANTKGTNRTVNRVLIVSDSHGLTEELTIIKDRHQLQYNIHCGDSELSTSAPQLADYHTVSGNCDWKGEFTNERLIDIGGLRFYITHGHLYGVKSTLMKLQYRAQEVEADVICFGHSHIAYAEEIDQKLYLNPGSIRLPKQSVKPSYIIMEWDECNEVHVHFFHINSEKITNFPYAQKFNLK